MQALALFNQTTTVATREYKNGSTLTGLVGRKAYGEIHGLKGAELKRRHYAYLMENGQAGCAALGAITASGQYVVTKMKKSEDGRSRLDVTLVAKESFDAPKAERVKTVNGLEKNKVQSVLKDLGLSEAEIEAKLALMAQ